ncbi:glycoside hydrolase [Planoprotostelium fungivorum]|uniref:Glycoside hydrolase n=1 Tax=Planoprotostelium fungivorum TaxID=1890364 RepID=A0A2P6NYU3_9EUKA|nr:glycoside hydrolase [Planoprotostelium fungivorum]
MEDTTNACSSSGMDTGLVDRTNPAIANLRKTTMRRRTIIVFAAIIGLIAASSDWNPVANPAAVVKVQNARFTVLKEWYSETKQFEDRPTIAIVNRYFEDVPQFSVSRSSYNVTISTSTLSLTYTGGEFGQQSLQIRRVDSDEVLWHFGMKDNGNLFGTLRTLDGADGAVELDCDKNPNAENAHCTYGVLSRSGWAIVNDTEDQKLKSDPAWEHWVDTAPTPDTHDLYFFGHGTEFKTALKDFTSIGGEIPLPPRYVFGTWYSKYWAYSDVELKDVINQYETHQTPLDVLVTDMDWHITFYKEAAQGKRDPAGEIPGWTGFTWDKNLFPNSTEFLEFCKSKGLRNTLNLHPASGVQPYEERYPEMARASGIDPASQQYVPFDITSSEFAANLHDIMLKPIWNEGIDFWWLDWQQSETTSIPGLNPTIWLNHVFWQNYNRWQTKTRPTVFHRWGGLGNHRYPIGFSGDVVPSWASLAFQPYFTQVASNVGYAFWSHDLGGHVAPSPPELFTRWTQWGLFSPVFRPHCTKDANNDRRIWTYPLVNFEIMRNVVNLRSSLVPHIYTLARQTHETGVGHIVAPLYYFYSDDERSYNYPNEYSWGESVVVAPVAAPVDSTGLAISDIYLPKGFRWVNWFTGRVHDATEQVIESQELFTLAEIPAYVKTGSIITYWPIAQKPLLGSAYNAPSVLGLQVFVDGTADQASGEFKVYEDNGDNRDHTQGGYAWTHTAFSQTKQRLSLTVEAPQGSYEGMPSQYSYEFKFTGSLSPSSVRVNGQTINYKPDNAAGTEDGWRYCGETLSVIVNLAVRSRSSLNVVVDLPQPLQSELFNGVAGLVARAKDAKRTLDYEWGINTIYQEDYTLLIQITELGSVMSAAPDRVLEILKSVPQLNRDAYQQLTSINYGNSTVIKAVTAQIAPRT